MCTGSAKECTPFSHREGGCSGGDVSECRMGKVLTEAGARMVSAAKKGELKSVQGRISKWLVSLSVEVSCVVPPLGLKSIVWCVITGKAPCVVSVCMGKCSCFWCGGAEIGGTHPSEKERMRDLVGYSKIPTHLLTLPP
jgi:hypothetical protein